MMENFIVSIAGYLDALLTRHKFKVINVRVEKGNAAQETLAANNYGPALVRCFMIERCLNERPPKWINVELR